MRCTPPLRVPESLGALVCTDSPGLGLTGNFHELTTRRSEWEGEVGLLAEKLHLRPLAFSQQKADW